MCIIQWLREENISKKKWKKAVLIGRYFRFAVQNKITCGNCTSHVVIDVPLANGDF